MMTEPTLATLLNIDQTVTPPRIAASGDWVLAQYAHLEPAISALQPQLLSNAVFDLSQLGELDTAGAALLVKLMGEQKCLSSNVLPPRFPQSVVSCCKQSERHYMITSRLPGSISRG